MKEIGKPESNSDVINKEPKVLLIGYGWVGQYMAKYFKTAHYVESDGIIKQASDNENVELDLLDQSNVKHYDLAIIGVPTPMNPETGQCDVSIVEKSVDKYAYFVNNFLVKSTVEIGTCERLENKYQVAVCMSPEYVGETLGHPLLEARRDAFQIIGGNKVAREQVAEYFMTVLHASAPIHLCSSREAEIIKYCENMWIMRRVDYWNDVFEVCETLDGSFQAVREGIVLDPRMSRTHSNIYRKNRGWSGKCLPKDMNALAHKMRSSGNNLPILEHLIERNARQWRSDIKSSEQLTPKKPLWLQKNKEGFSGNRGNQ